MVDHERPTFKHRPVPKDDVCYIEVFKLQGQVVYLFEEFESADFK